MKKINKNFETQLVSLPIKVLKVDRYQKRIREQKVRNIVGNFDPVSLGVIHVSLRDDGTHWIFDGQHRVEALRRLGIDYVLCLVFTGLTYEQEAEGFAGHHEVSKPTKIEEHNAKLEAKNPTAIQVEKVLNNLGLAFINGGGRRTVQSVAAVYEVYERKGEETLEKVLYTIREAFGDEDRPYNQNLIKGLSDLFAEYKEEVDIKWLVKKLAETNTGKLNLMADNMRDIYSCSKRESVKMAITQRYNHNKSDRLKLK